MKDKTRQELEREYTKYNRLIMALYPRFLANPAEYSETYYETLAKRDHIVAQLSRL